MNTDKTQHGKLYRCQVCGRFIAYDEIDGNTNPEFIRGEIQFTHKACEKDGKFTPIYIVMAIDSEFGISIEDMREKTRKKEIVWARWLCYKAIHANTTLSMQQIVDMFNQKKHENVIYGIKQLEYAVGWRKEWVDKVKYLWDKRDIE